jgi:hypothetical protein
MPSNYAGNPANYPVTVTRPSDGDNEDSASIDVAIDALLDRTAWLAARTGGYRLVSVAVFDTPDSGSFNDTWSTGSFVDATASANTPAVGTLLAGDRVEVIWHGRIRTTGTSGQIRLLAVDTSGTATLGTVYVPEFASDDQTVSAAGLLTVAAGAVSLKLAGLIDTTGGGNAMRQVGATSFLVKVWRSN